MIRNTHTYLVVFFALLLSSGSSAESLLRVKINMGRGHLSHTDAYHIISEDLRLGESSRDTLSLADYDTTRGFWHLRFTEKEGVKLIIQSIEHDQVRMEVEYVPIQKREAKYRHTLQYNKGKFWIMLPPIEATYFDDDPEYTALFGEECDYRSYRGRHPRDSTVIDFLRRHGGDALAYFTTFSYIEYRRENRTEARCYLHHPLYIKNAQGDTVKAKYYMSHSFNLQFDKNGHIKQNTNCPDLNQNPNMFFIIDDTTALKTIRTNRGKRYAVLWFDPRRNAFMWFANAQTKHTSWQSMFFRNRYKNYGIKWQNTVHAQTGEVLLTTRQRYKGWRRRKPRSPRSPF